MPQSTSRRDLLKLGLALPSAAAAAALPGAVRAEESSSQRRPAAQPLAQDYSIIHRRDNPKTYVEGCGLIALDDGALLAIVPMVPRGGVPKQGPTAIHVIRSDDGGQTWQPQSELPYYSAAPFLHNGELYLFLFTMGKQHRNDDMHIAKSADGGKTWSEPVPIFQGHYWTCHTNMVQRDGQLYWAVDNLINGDTGNNRSPRAIAGDLSKNLLDPAAWRMSNLVRNPGPPPTVARAKYQGRATNHWLESDVIDLYGQLRLLATVKFQGQSTTNLCAVFDLNDVDNALQMEFVQYHPMPGGHLKFAVVFDEPSQLFWATVNFAVDGQEVLDWYREPRRRGEINTGGNDRRLLMLMYSVDALNWFQAGCIAQAPTVLQSFMYGKPLVQGDDLLVISRSNINGPNNHDADCATFHRVTDFRQLALHLPPQA